MEEQQFSMEQLEAEMMPICLSKAEEFHLLGYEQVTWQEIWECVIANYRAELPPIHKVVNDILSLKVTKFMNWLTMKVYKGEF